LKGAGEKRTRKTSDEGRGAKAHRKKTDGAERERPKIEIGQGGKT